MADERFDGMLLSMAQQVQGIDPLLDTVFSFLRRKTDFFTGADPARARQVVIGAFDRQAALAAGSKAPARDAEREAAARQRAEAKRQREADEAEAAMRAAAAAARAAAAEEPRVVELDENDQPLPSADAAPAPPAQEQAEGEQEEAEPAAEAAAGEEAEEEDTTPPPPGNGGSTEHFIWTQTLEEVTVTVPVPPGTKGRDVVCDFRPTHFRLGLKGQPLKVDGDFHKRVVCDDSFWVLEDNRFVVITLTKQNKMEWWKCVVQGDPEIDTSKVQPENSQLSDLDGETRQTVEKMMFDQRAKAAGQPTADERIKQETLKKFMDQHPEMDFSNAKIS